MTAPEWYPRPNDAGGHTEDMICAICNHEWTEWVKPTERTVPCPSCGYQNDLGRV